MTSEKSKAEQRGAVLDVLLEHSLISDEGDLDAWAVERIRAAIADEPVNGTPEVADQLDSEGLGVAGDLHEVADALIQRLLPAAQR